MYNIVFCKLERVSIAVLIVLFGMVFIEFCNFMLDLNPIVRIVEMKRCMGLFTCSPPAIDLKTRVSSARFVQFSFVFFFIGKLMSL